MELKHKDCFIGSLIRVFSLASIAHEVHEVWNYVNIYSGTRGTNRFKALLHTFEYLRKLERVQSLNINIPFMQDLSNWVKNTSILSNDNLIKLIVQVPEKNKKDLNNVLKWSEDVNQIIKSTVFKLPPMPGAVKTIKKLKSKVDFMVISNTPLKALNREWTQNNIYSDMENIGGQETGNKTEMLLAATKGKYEKNKILIIGDSPGDLKAAKNIKALFFPIIPLDEDGSWETFIKEGYKFFLNGNYLRRFQDDQIKKFELTLSKKPSWSV